MRSRSLLLLVMLVAAVLAAPATASTTHQTVTVNWHAQQAALGNSGQVPGAWATLVRNQGGISFEISTTSLHPGHAYTLWLVVVNDPDACSTSPCAAPDIIGNPDTRSQVRYAAGTIAGGSGRGTLASSVREGPLAGWLDGRTLEDATTAEIHLVVNDHGPRLAEYLPGMIQTYRGGCSDASPFPGIFPQTALDDGEPGPNVCRLYQAAVFLP
jgi:hypothetical protein